jgi:hypothetical protein
MGVLDVVSLEILSILVVVVSPFADSVRRHSCGVPRVFPGHQVAGPY